MPSAGEVIGGMLANMGPGLAGGLGKVLTGGEPNQQDKPVARADSKGGEDGSGLPKFKKGGMVPKTEVALVHKGELVIPKDKVDATHKAMFGLLTGKLHKHLGVDTQKAIPEDKVDKATKSSDHEVRTMALLHKEYAPLIHRIAKKAHTTESSAEPKWKQSASDLGRK